MTADGNGVSDEDLAEMNEALRMGLRRAGLHMVRAGYEVVAGVGALLDELVKARRAGGEEAAREAAPTRIEVE